MAIQRMLDVESLFDYVRTKEKNVLYTYLWGIIYYKCIFPRVFYTYALFFFFLIKYTKLRS